MPKSAKKSARRKTATGKTAGGRKGGARTTSTRKTAAKGRARSASAPRSVGGSKPPPALKARLAEVATTTSRINGMKNSMSKNFFDVGVLLNKIRDNRLYEVKGYGSFESFVEREISMSKVICLRSARIAEAMHREVAVEAGLERSAAAVAALDGEELVDAMVARPSGRLGSALPAHKR